MLPIGLAKYICPLQIVVSPEAEGEEAATSNQLEMIVIRADMEVVPAPLGTTEVVATVLKTPTMS